MGGLDLERGGPISYSKIKRMCDVIIPMREIAVVEKVNTSEVLPNALHITTKSKVGKFLIEKNLFIFCLGCVFVCLFERSRFALQSNLRLSFSHSSHCFDKVEKIINYSIKNERV